MTARGLAGELRPARAIDIVRSAVVQHAASHVIHVVVRVSG